MALGRRAVVRAGRQGDGQESVTEAVVELHQPPRLLFDDGRRRAPPHPNLIRFRLGKDDGVTLTVQAKTPGQELETQEVDLSVDFAAALGERQEPYERLLHDALDGNTRRFARQDVVEQTWRIVQPALDEPGPIRFYDRGSWGPTAADYAARRRPLALGARRSQRQQGDPHEARGRRRRPGAGWPSAPRSGWPTASGPPSPSGARPTWP